jgi:hypothetical protein
MIPEIAMVRCILACTSPVAVRLQYAAPLGSAPPHQLRTLPKTTGLDPRFCELSLQGEGTYSCRSMVRKVNGKF